MDVIFMKSVRAWAEYSREARTCRGSHCNAKVTRYSRIGWPHDEATFEHDGANVQGIRPAVLSQFSTHNTILAAAFKGIKNIRSA